MNSIVKLTVFLVLASIPSSSYAQASGVYRSKAYSKDEALYKAKAYVMKDVLGVEESITRFNIDPLAASMSGELTSLVYECEQKHLRGLVLGFFGDYWNDAGVVYQAYAFKNLPENKAYELLTKLDNLMKEQSKYLGSDIDNNNVFFSYDDMVFLIYADARKTIRVFWNDFDSEWESTAFKRTKKRLERHLNDTDK